MAKGMSGTEGAAGGRNRDRTWSDSPSWKPVLLFQEGIEGFTDGASGEITRSKPGVKVFRETMNSLAVIILVSQRGMLVIKSMKCKRPNKGE